ncbi:MAG: translation initiation factor IF-3 [Candidatus Parcubacteria bacterium]|nr:MAG: translation initiation factor IF-3 [Candidatus Parcubacteria bacterium]
MIDPRLSKIKLNKVRLIDENGKQIGILEFEEVKKIAEEKNTGLILISEKANPPVLKLGDYNKYLYNLKKKQKEKNVSEIKEIRISFQEAEGDLKRKAKQIEEFLNEGHQIRIRMLLKGRQMLHLELAKERLNKFINFIEIPVKIINEVKQSGNNLIILISKR